MYSRLFKLEWFEWFEGRCVVRQRIRFVNRYRYISLAS